MTAWTRALACLFLLSSMDAVAQKASSEPSTAALQRRLAALERQVTELTQSYLSHVASTTATSVTFDPASQSYGIVDAGLSAKFAVAIEKVDPFADGVAVTLAITPLYSARYSDLQLSLRYGKRMPGIEDFSNEEYEKWDNSLQSAIDPALNHWTVVRNAAMMRHAEEA